MYSQLRVSLYLLILFLWTTKYSKRDVDSKKSGGRLFPFDNRSLRLRFKGCLLIKLLCQWKERVNLKVARYASSLVAL